MALTCFWRSSDTAITMVDRFLSLAILRSSDLALTGSKPRSDTRVSESAERSDDPLPSVRRLSAFLRNSAMRLSGERTISISTPSSFMRRTSAMVSVPIATCACMSLAVFWEVIPLMIRCASASGSDRLAWTSLSFSARSFVSPLPSPRICSACARYALSASPLCTMPTSIGVRPRMSPSCVRRTNSDWSRSASISIPMGPVMVSP
mmetsp:Transcript_31252/g.50211  ORF Transcript_31252/g.50211 Transcript_31252/m.50211 type:complete len:206 (-) Transcript_31252:2474-3091(-)